ncbi:hypothetical protein B0J14DRAFT_122443 [Halenospora varia]|nr:hypothetical protein B0J14DRAFT_122443 [Halenospora varia]
MVLPDGQKLTKDLIPRDPVNTDAPGLQGNKNGPPGPAGNKKGPPTAAPTTTTEAPTTSPIQVPPSESIVSPFSTPSPGPAFSSPASTPSPTTPPAPITTSTSEVSPSFTSPSVTSTSVALAPSIYYETSPVTSTPYLVTTTLRTIFAGTSSSTALPTGLVSFPPNTAAQFGHSTLGPGQKAGIAVGTIGAFKASFHRDRLASKANNQEAGFPFLLTLIFLLFKWRRGELPKAVPCLSRRWLGTGGDSRWWSYSQTPEEMSDSLLTADVGSRRSLGWDYRSTFAPPAVTRKSRRSLPRSLRRLVQFNPLGQNPVTPHAPGEGTSNRNSFASFFHRRSTASASRSVIDVESPPSLPPLPAGFPPPRSPAISRRPREIVQSDTEDFLRPQTLPAEVLPPTFHRSWCYRNSQITLASEESDARSFKSVPGWVKFHYPHRMRNDRGALLDSRPALPAPQTTSPGSWLKAKILRRSQSMTASEEKGGIHSGSDNGDESASTESPVLGPGGWKQTQVGNRMSCESADSLALEKQEPWQI